MGTRSMTIVMDDDKELCRIYRQYDGYPSGHGLDLAELCKVKIVNGFSPDAKAQANGMGCLAAQIVKGLKDGVGGIYLEPTGGEVNDWCEYVYIVTGKVGEFPNIQCTTQSGPFPFNIQDKSKLIFSEKADKITESFLKNLEDTDA